MDDLLNCYKERKLLSSVAIVPISLLHLFGLNGYEQLKTD